MIFPTLAFVLIASAGAGILGARGLLRMNRRFSRPIAIGTSIGYVILLFWRPDSPWVPNVSILLAGICFGFLLGQLLGSSGSVLTFLCTAAIVDMLSFSDGLTNQIVEAYRSGGSTVLRFLAVFIELGGQEYAVIGVSDIAIVAAAYLGLHRATGSDWGPAFWLLLGLFFALLAGTLWGGAPGIPFLAAGAGVFILLQRRNQARARDQAH